MMSFQVSCTVCDSNSYNSLFSIPPRSIVECSNCGHEYVNPIPNPNNVPELNLHSSKKKTIGTQIDIAYLTKLFAKYNLRKEKLLDLGCGVGRLEKKLIDIGWAPQNLYLMDISKKSLEVARRKYLSSMFIQGDAQEGTGFSNYFDCILMVELLEHLSDPKKAVQNALTALKPGGILIMRGIPNNMSLEAFIGQDNWKMRQFIQHYQFFNHTTFSAFASKFSEAKILEFGTFLQEGYCFYDIIKIARNIGIVKESRGDIHITYSDDVIKTGDLTDLVLEKVNGADFNKYKHQDRLSAKQVNSLSSTADIEAFFNLISLDEFLSPDFSVVIQKEGK